LTLALLLWLGLANPRTLAESMAYYNVPGVGVAAIDDYEIAWAKGYGLLGMTSSTFVQPLPEALRAQATSEHDMTGKPLPVDTIDLVVIVVANLFNLLMAAIFVMRPRGWKRFERIVGLVLVALALPLGAAAILNLLANREWWFVVLPLPLILFCLVELLLDYILKKDFRQSRWLGPYLALFYLGQIGLVGYAFATGALPGFVTLVTYFLCLGATRYAHAKGVG
jgi:hypothetical protein